MNLRFSPRCHENQTLDLQSLNLRRVVLSSPMDQGKHFDNHGHKEKKQKKSGNLKSSYKLLNMNLNSEVLV